MVVTVQGKVDIDHMHVSPPAKTVEKNKNPWETIYKAIGENYFYESKISLKNFYKNARPNLMNHKIFKMS